MTSPIALLRSSNIKPVKQLGQNFLTDPSTAEMIISRSNLSEQDIILEIGAGLGALTIPAARIVKKVYAVEKDRKITRLLKTELLVNHLSNVEIIEKDVLNIDIVNIAAKEGTQIIVMGNLPYNISSQILVRLINARRSVKKAILMFQKELAQRIATGPGSKDYGRLSVMLQYCADIKTTAAVKATLFYPKPKVDSDVLEINFRESISFPADDEMFLFSVIKAAFGQRRKTLKNALSGSRLKIDGKTALTALENAGIEPARRAETLSVEEFVKLSNLLYRL